MTIEKRVAEAEKVIELGHAMEKIMDRTINQYPDAYYHIVALKYDLNQYQEQVILSCLLRNFVEQEYEFNTTVEDWKNIARQVEFFWWRKTSDGWEVIEELKDYKIPVIDEWGKLCSDYCRTMRGLIRMAREEDK